MNGRTSDCTATRQAARVNAVVVPGTMMKRASIVKAVVSVLALWIVLLFVMPCGGARARAELTRLRAEIMRIEGREMSEAELNAALSELHLVFKTNRYIPQVTHTSPKDWTVRLTPESRRAYVNPHPWLFRVLFLKFHTMDFPDLEFGSQEGHNIPLHGTRGDARP